MSRWSMMKNIHSPNLVGIGSWGPEIWPHEYLLSPIEISVNWPGSNSYEPGQLFTLISMGLIRYSCGHISGPHEPIRVKFGVWRFFIILYRNMVMKMLKCKQKILMTSHFGTLLKYTYSIRTWRRNAKMFLRIHVNRLFDYFTIILLIIVQGLMPFHNYSVSNFVRTNNPLNWQSIITPFSCAQERHEFLRPTRRCCGTQIKKKAKKNTFLYHWWKFQNILIQSMTSVKMLYNYLYVVVVVVLINSLL